MYITIGWKVTGPTPPATVAQEIIGQIGRLGFEPSFTAHGNLILADISKNQNPTQVQLLHNALRVVARGRYSYVITMSPNFWDFVASDDIENTNAATLRAISMYET